MSASMRLKPDISIAGVKPETVIGMMVAQSVCATMGYEFCITSVAEGKHRADSRHYMGLAFDMRTRHMKPNDVAIFRDELARRLGPDWDVVIEATHLHIEFDPKVTA